MTPAAPPPPDIDRIVADVDPAIVANGIAARQAWAERIGRPKRCETNVVHPGLGCCLFCGAESGEECAALQETKRHD